MSKFAMWVSGFTACGALVAILRRDPFAIILILLSILNWWIAE